MVRPFDGPGHNGMLDSLLTIAEIVAGAGTLASVGYYVLGGWSSYRFLHEARWSPERRKRESRHLGDERRITVPPPVSVLKPLKGLDPQMWEGFRSHCRQDYPQYEIIFGVSDAADPAIEVVQRLQVEYPKQEIRLVLCDEDLGANTKVSNLAQMVLAARYENLVVNDSDIRVGPDYLKRIMAALSNPGIGLVTCLYRGVPAATLGSHLEALGISTDFAVGVLAARQVEGGIRFGLGSTLALRRRELNAIGGFEALADYLADDYELGARIAGMGRRIVLSPVVVETFLPAYSFRQYFAHQLRWARTVRDARPWGYLGLLLTFGLPWATLLLLLSWGDPWAWALLGLTVVARLAVALAVGVGVLGEERLPRDLLLLPLRDFTAAAIWAAGFVGHTLEWRGSQFSLKNGRLVRIA